MGKNQMKTNKKISDLVRGADKALTSIWIFLGLVAVVLFVVYAFNNRSGKKDDSNNANNSQYEALDENCKVTPDSELLYPDNEPLETITQIASIDYNADVYHTQLVKNQIPAILSPKFINKKDADYCLSDDSTVIVVKKDDVVKVYPKSILENHLAINDSIKGQAILVSRCNICDNFAVYIREYEHEELFFGVSGKLYRNNDLFFDNKTESLWSQLDGTARVGTLTDAKLQKYPFEVLSFSQAKKRYPDAKYMSFDTGFRGNYKIEISDIFAEDSSIVAPVTNTDPSLPLKDLIIGFTYKKNSYAIAKDELINSGSKTVRVAGNDVKISLNGDEISSSNPEIKPLQAYWYVWYDFYPQTVLFD